VEVVSPWRIDLSNNKDVAAHFSFAVCVLNENRSRDGDTCSSECVDRQTLFERGRDSEGDDRHSASDRLRKQMQSNLRRCLRAVPYRIQEPAVLVVDFE